MMILIAALLYLTGFVRSVDLRTTLKQYQKTERLSILKYQKEKCQFVQSVRVKAFYQVDFNYVQSQTNPTRQPMKFTRTPEHNALVAKWNQQTKDNQLCRMAGVVRPIKNINAGIPLTWKQRIILESKKDTLSFAIMHNKMFKHTREDRKSYV